MPHKVPVLPASNGLANFNITLVSLGDLEFKVKILKFNSVLGNTSVIFFVCEYPCYLHIAILTLPEL